MKKSTQTVVASVQTATSTLSNLETILAEVGLEKAVTVTSTEKGETANGVKWTKVTLSNGKIHQVNVYPKIETKNLQLVTVYDSQKWTNKQGVVCDQFKTKLFSPGVKGSLREVVGTDAFRLRDAYVQTLKADKKTKVVA
jgi:hypothetical protein